MDKLLRYYRDRLYCDCMRLTIYSPTAILGYGFPRESYENAINNFDIDVIACDAGSTDPGPYYLGSGKSFTDPYAVKRDLELLLSAREKLGIPLIISTAGGSGSKIHLDSVVNLVMEIAEKYNMKFKLAKIYSDVDKTYLKEKLREGKVTILDYEKELTEKDIDEAVRIVAQLGVEPFIEAVNEGADVVIAGRAVDIAPFASIPIMKGMDKGLAYHCSKILECGAIAAEPGSGADGMIGIISNGYFEVTPSNPKRKCTVKSVVAHTLYEKGNPFVIRLPGGEVYIKESVYEQLDERTVRVYGSRFIEKPYTLLIEGVKHVGYRTISIAGVRDPILIEKIQEVIDGVKREVYEIAGENKYILQFRLYGLDAVPLWEYTQHVKPAEIGVIIDVVAESRELANKICALARSTLLHYGFEGRITTAGNLAFPFSPSDIEVGEVYEFNIHHLLRVDDPLEIAKVEYMEV